MFFDEPTLALDPEQVEVVLRVMQNLAKEEMSKVVLDFMKMVKNKRIIYK